MKKTLFFACIVLAIWGCSGDMDELPPCLNCHDLCGSQRYDRSTQSCCNHEIYSKETQFCSEGTVYSKCNKSTYKPSTEGCCDNIKYTKETHFCSGNLVYSKCSGSDYATSTQYCSNGTLKAYSGAISYAGQTYKTQVIGIQTWFAENLNYNASGSKCYENEPNNCTVYGRLYDWATAMTLPSSCDSTFCSSQIQPLHRGICPTGWHIPSYDDWYILMNYAGGDSVAGWKLKATGGWYNCGPSGSGSSYVCEDAYGFSALPYSDGRYGFWWSTSENGTKGAHGRDMRYDREYAYWGNGLRYKSELYSVRCVQDAVSNGRGNSISNYKTVVINDQTWMAENLDYAIEGSKCKNNNPANCIIYGRLYDWVTAMNLPSSCKENNCSSQIQAKHRGICPSGWHIPSKDEWDVLMDNVGGYETAGTKLKATSGWNSYNGVSGNGTDNYGFSALPGGGGNSGGSFYGAGYGGWWGASEGENYNYNYNYNYKAYYLDIYYDDDKYGYGNGVNKSSLFSVRCLQD